MFSSSPTSSSQISLNMIILSASSLSLILQFFTFFRRTHFLPSMGFFSFFIFTLFVLILIINFGIVTAERLAALTCSFLYGHAVFQQPFVQCANAFSLVIYRRNFKNCYLKRCRHVAGCTSALHYW